MARFRDLQPEPPRSPQYLVTTQPRSHRFDISKQEATLTKIEMAAVEIAKENKRRKRERHEIGEIGMGPQPLCPSYVPTKAHRDFKRGMITAPDKLIRASNKVLCGRLSVLCDVMRGAGIPYPWRVVAG